MDKKYIDRCEDRYDVHYDIEETLFSTKNQYQSIQVKKSKNFGNMLIIDDDIQLTDFDEKNYHEMIVHVPLNYFSKLVRVLILGGGDGGTLREVVRHNNVSQVIMVDIDKDVVETSIKYMPNIFDNSFNNPKAKIIIENGFEYVNTYTGPKFDIVLIDLTDFNQSEPLFTKSFYANLKKIVNENFLISFNADNIFWNEPYILDMIKDVSIFKYTALYNTYVSTYAGGFYSFCLLSDTIDPLNFNIDWECFNRKQLELDYYNKDIHISSFSLPNKIKNKIKKIKSEKITPVKGIHYMVDINNVDTVILNDENQLNAINIKAIEIAGMTLLNKILHKFTPQGITGIYLLGESHLSFHTWPEHNFISLDLYTCGDINKCYNAVEYILSCFKSTNYKLTVNNR